MNKIIVNNDSFTIKGNDGSTGFTDFLLEAFSPIFLMTIMIILTIIAGFITTILRNATMDKGTSSPSIKESRKWVHDRDGFHYK